MYDTIIFDLDDTLTNDTENIRQAFKTILEYRKEDYTNEKFVRFHKIDKKLWSDRSAGRLITPYEDNKEKLVEYLRSKRFLDFFENKISYEEAVKINEIYLEGMKKTVIPQEGAYEIIKYLYSKNYKLVIATNGPLVPLQEKIKKIKIDKYISFIFSAEEVGYMKPHKQFYNGLFKKIDNKTKENILFVGDSLETDIKGGIENNLDTCWCNYTSNKNPYKYFPKYEIHKLDEISKIL